MKREQIDKDKLLHDNHRLRKENKHLITEVEGLTQACTRFEEDNTHMKAELDRY